MAKTRIRVSANCNFLIKGVSPFFQIIERNIIIDFDVSRNGSKLLVTRFPVEGKRSGEDLSGCVLSDQRSLINLEIESGRGRGEWILEPISRNTGGWINQVGGRGCRKSFGRDLDFPFSTVYRPLNCSPFLSPISNRFYSGQPIITILPLSSRESLSTRWKWGWRRMEDAKGRRKQRV